MPGKIRTLIYGSCVSRDTFSHLPASDFELVRYVARQSLISAYSPAVTSMQPPTLESAFQQRMVRWDFASALPDILKENSNGADLVLWDLIDERLGVYVLPDDTAVTRSVDLIAADAERPLSQVASLFEFGSDEHLSMFAATLPPFLQSLRTYHPNARVALLMPPWAERTESGAPTPASFGLPAETANRLYERYYEIAAAMPGVTAVGRYLDVTAAAEHAWGEAPFHYQSTTYERLAAAIAALSHPGANGSPLEGISKK